MGDKLIDRIDIQGVVLCGGQSRRFGSPKPFVEFQGVRLVDRASSLLASICGDVCLAVGDDRTSPWPPGSLVYDHLGGIGPIAGMHAALTESERTWLFVLAVDLPRMTSGAVAKILSEGREGDLAVVATDQSGRPQPLCALYHRSILPHIQAAIDRKEYGPTRLLSGLSNVRYVTLPDEQLRNANTPDDLS